MSDYARRRKRFRRKIWESSEKKCFYCRIDLVWGGDPKADNAFTIEHLKARVYGGKTNRANCRAACNKCNREKGCKNMLEFLVQKDKDRKAS